MSKIVLDFNGYATLDGHPLMRDEKLEIVWPDGKKTVETIQIETQALRSYGRGWDGEFRESDSVFVAKEYHGQLSRIYIDDLEVKRVDPPQPKARGRFGRG